MVGQWTVNVNKSGMPQKIASAFGKLNETLLGAEYRFIAYLGTQVVNGTNHAVLAEQLVLSGKDTKNIVVIIFNEKPNDIEATLVDIERVIEGGGALGGMNIDVQDPIPEEAQQAFQAAKEGFVGSRIELIALLGTQVTKGTDYVFAATVTPVVPDPVSHLALVKANGMTKDLAISDLLASRHDAALSLGYAFTWLKK